MGGLRAGDEHGRERFMRWDIGIDLGTRNVRMVTEGAKEAFGQSAALALRAGLEYINLAERL